MKNNRRVGEAQPLKCKCSNPHSTSILQCEQENEAKQLPAGRALKMHVLWGMMVIMSIMSPPLFLVDALSALKRLKILKLSPPSRTGHALHCMAALGHDACSNDSMSLQHTRIMISSTLIMLAANVSCLSLLAIGYRVPPMVERLSPSWSWSWFCSCSITAF